jgi:hypothetical protein
MRSLLIERARRALTECLPFLRDAEMSPLGQGTDHMAFRVGDYVVRVGNQEETTGEGALLDHVRPRVTLAVPEPLYARGGVMIYPWLPGSPLLGRELPPGGAAALGGFIRQLHDIPLGLVGGLVPHDLADPADWLVGLSGAPEWLASIRADLPPAAASFVFCHADLGAEHILADGETITGVIDWSDAAITDPALDFARIYRDFGPLALDAALDAYGGLPGAFPRIRFFARCAAIEDIAWGQRIGDERYVQAGMAALTWLFPSGEAG